MIAKKFYQITENDLQALVDNAVLELKTIEYKKSLPSNLDSARKEFLADVSSFANAVGGDLIYGITQNAETGVPEKLEGLEITNEDQEILRLENMIRHGIEPRIPSVQTRSIRLSNAKIVLVIRVARSWIGPHRVSFKGWDKFFSRSSNGKYPMDVSELRTAFTLSETITERIRRFREDRLGKIIANETPVPFYDSARIVLHLIPIVAFEPGKVYDLNKVSQQPGKIRPIYCHGWNHRYNLDGFLTYSGGFEEKSHSYIQLYRNGIVEAVEGLLLKPDGGELQIPSIALEKELMSSLDEYLYILNTLDVELPVFIFVTLVGVKGYVMTHRESHKIDRDVLLLPEVVLESYETESKDLLRPCFNSIWNACGFPKSMNYDNQGQWRPHTT